MRRSEKKVFAGLSFRYCNSIYDSVKALTGTQLTNVTGKSLNILRKMSALLVLLLLALEIKVRALRFVFFMVRPTSLLTE